MTADMQNPMRKEILDKAMAAALDKSVTVPEKLKALDDAMRELQDVRNEHNALALLSCVVFKKFLEQRQCNDELEARVAELEAQQPFEYAGTFEQGNKDYRKGQFVTHNGGLWHCNAKTSTRPGESAEWTLAVKSGRDAR